jgi:N-acetylglucosamine-6-phosphate deacetylase
MTEIWIAPEHLFDGQNVLSGKAVQIAGGQVVGVANAPKSARHIGGCLTPGFIDLQVNGGGGVQLNATPTRSGMAQIAAAHRHFGTIAIMPTVITDDADVLDKTVDAVIAAKGDDGIVGLHIEGPHISLVRRGTHDGRYVRPMDQRTLDAVARLRRHDIAVMITVAPEATTNAQITTLARLGAVVSLGHTDATADEIGAAIAAGAVCATHLFNAMSPMTSRAPGTVGAILNSHIHAGIICDGYHVDDRMIELALRARPADDLMFLVSDAMATVGGPDNFDLYDQRVRLEGGRLINKEGNLAGAHITQAEGVARLVHHIGQSVELALRMAITVPARVVGQVALSQIVGRATRDLLVLSDGCRVTGTLEDILADGLATDTAQSPV